MRRALGLSFLLFTRGAFADAVSEIAYEAPPGCPVKAAFHKEVSARVSEIRPAHRTYAVRLAHVFVGWEGTLTATDEAGAAHGRTVRGATCGDVTHALAFVTAIALELGRMDDEPEPPKPTPKTDPLRTIAPPPPLPPPIATPTKRSWNVNVGFAAAGRGGMAASLRPSGEISFELDWQGTHAVSPSFYVAAIGGTNLGASSSDLWLAGGRAGVCPVRWRNAVVQLRPCAGMELAGITARGRVARPQQGETAWIAPEISGIVRFFAFGPLFLDVGASLLFPLIQTQYRVDDRTVYVVPPVTGRLFAGFGVRL